MAAAPPVDYEPLGMLGERMVQAHRFFSEQARQWLLQGHDVLFLNRDLVNRWPQAVQASALTTKDPPDDHRERASGDTRPSQPQTCSFS